MGFLIFLAQNNLRTNGKLSTKFHFNRSSIYSYSKFQLNRLSCFGGGGWIPNLFSPKPSQDHREASHKISSQSEQYLQVYQYSKFQLNRLSCFGERAWILQLFSLKPSLDQEEASHKISSQQVQPFHKQTTFYFYSIALYISYYKNRMSSNCETAKPIELKFCGKLPLGQGIALS